MQQNFQKKQKKKRDLAYKNRSDSRLAMTEPPITVYREDQPVEVGSLSVLHSHMNNNTSLCGPTDSEHKHFNIISKMDTKIHRCKYCGQNLLGAAAYKIHLHERHSTLITEEADGPQNETMMKAALGLIKK